MTKIYVSSKAALKECAKELRQNGYMIITFGNKLIELEKDNRQFIIEYRKAVKICTLG